MLIILSPPTEPFAPGGNETQTSTKSEEFRARVSSAVLRHDSPILAKEFDPSGPWKQPHVQPDGLIHKELEDFDPSALVHVLNIIHLRINLVPPTLPLVEIAKVAVIVDYFQCHDAIAFAAQSWTQGYKEFSPGTFTRTDLLWLFVSAVFGNAQICYPIGDRAVRFGMGPFETHGLPVPEKVVGEDTHTQIESLVRKR